MCVYSMIMDHYKDKWFPQSPNPYPFPPSLPTITLEEIFELKELLRKAKEYDKKHNQPDCELEEKKKKLKDLANMLGIEIEFP